MARQLTRFNPISDLVRTGSFPDIADLLKDFAMVPTIRGLETEPRMRVDVRETEQAYSLEAEVPGAKKDDITISIDGNRVSIKVDIKEQESGEENSGSLLRNERIFGEEYRTFSLPQPVDESAAEAKYDNGILRLRLPKKTGAGGKKVTVQ